MKKLYVKDYLDYPAQIPSLQKSTKNNAKKAFRMF